MIKKIKSRSIYYVMSSFIIFSVFWMGISIAIKNENNKTRARIDGNYTIQYKILSEYTVRIKEKEVGIEQELKANIEKEENSLYIATYKNALSYYYLSNNNYEMYDKYVKEAISEYKKEIDGIALMIKTYSYMISNEIYMENYNKALEYCYKAVELIDSPESKYIEDQILEDFKIIINCNYINILVNNNLSNKATKYYEKIRVLEKDDITYKNNEHMILFSKLLYNDAIGNEEEAIKSSKDYYEKAKMSNSNNTEGLKFNIGKALIRAGRLDEGIQYVKDAEKFYKNKKNNNIGLANVYFMYGEYLEEKNEYKQALEYYTKSYEKYKLIKTSYNSKKEVIEAIFRMAEKGNFSINIKEYLKEYIKANKNADESMSSLFVTMEEINEKTYRSTLLLRERERIALEKSDKDKQVLILLLGASVILLIAMLGNLKKEIIKKKKYEKKLKEIIEKDFLTGCRSRSYGMERLEKLKKENRQFSIALIDIDNFKKINDTYGHIAGDEVLKTLGNILNESINNGLAMRYGGEEFLIGLETEKEETYKVIEEIRCKVENTTFSENLTVTISAGVKEWQGEGIKDLIKSSDNLLYKAKRSGKNKVCM